MCTIFSFLCLTQMFSRSDRVILCASSTALASCGGFPEAPGHAFFCPSLPF